MRIEQVGGVLAVTLIAAIFPNVQAVGAQANRPPHAPALLSPADDHTFEHGEPQVFALSAVDPDGDPYTALVTVRDAVTGDEEMTVETSPAPSGGSTRAVALLPLKEGSYTWSAHGIDVFGAVGDESDSRTVHVGRPAVAGAGDLHGDLGYTSSGIPPGPCVPTEFEMDARSEAAVVDAAITGFVGELDIDGAGSAPCEDLMVGAGELTLDVSGVGPTNSTLSCPHLSGSFLRIGTSFTAELTGECEINEFATGPTTWSIAAQIASDEVGGGVTTSIRQATLAGSFTVRSLRQAESAI